MMNWNKNDTKYILKRLILYLLITGIVFFAGQRCAKAVTISANINPTTHMQQITGNSKTIPIQVDNNNVEKPIFKNAGDGYITFNLLVWNAQSYTNQMNDILVGNGVETFVCKNTGAVFWQDNTNANYLISVECPVSLTNNRGIKYLMIERVGNANTLNVKLPYVMSFTSNQSEASQINQQAQNIANTQLQNDNTNTQYILDAIDLERQQIAQQSQAINNASNQAHQDAQAQTDAINAQTQWQQQDFLSDTTQVSAITDLISAGDKNQIRDLMMFPARILMIVGGHISSDYCYSFNLGNLYGTNLVLPCINWKQYVGNDLYNTIDVILSIGIYIGLIIYVRKLLDYVFSLGQTGFNSVNVEVFK